VWKLTIFYHKGMSRPDVQNPAGTACEWSLGSRPPRGRWADLPAAADPGQLASEKEALMGGRFRDLSGQKIEGTRWTVLSRAPNNERRQACWYCECECGTTKVISSADLKSGKTRSCGCLRRQKLAQRVTKHGHARNGENSAEYKAWQSMKTRVLNPKNKNYKYYSGRGIAICSRWLNGEDGLSGFECFLLDMGPRPSPKHENDRIDPNGNYKPANCQWSTEKEAAVHTRIAHQIPLPDGRTVTRRELSRLLGLTDDKLNEVVSSTRKSIASGATAPAEQSTRVGIQLIFWMLAASILKGPDDHNPSVRAFLLCLRNTARVQK
jgi:hypothetical protein